VIAPAWIERVLADMPELPGAMAARFERDDGLSAYDAAMMVQSSAFARYYEAVRNTCGDAKLAANWLMGEVSKRLNAQALGIEDAPVTAEELGEIIRSVRNAVVHHSGARQLLEHLWSTRSGHHTLRPGAGQYSMQGQLVELIATLVDQMGLKQMNDAGALEAIVDQVLAANAKSVDEFRAGKDRAFNALVGQVMKASKGQANPAQAGELLKKKLAG